MMFAMRDIKRKGENAWSARKRRAQWVDIGGFEVRIVDYVVHVKTTRRMRCIQRLERILNRIVAVGNVYQTITKMVLSANLAQRTNVDLGSIVVRHARRPQIPLA